MRGIIDSTEFYIEKPGRNSSQRSTFSSYKSRNTFKLLISVSPIPHILFPTYTVEIFSDKELTEECGFVKQLNGGDVIMADKGFNVQDLFALKHVRLLAPPIMAKGKVSSKTTTMTSRIATARANVELMIRKSTCLVNLNPIIVNEDDANAVQMIVKVIVVIITNRVPPNYKTNGLLLVFSFLQLALHQTICVLC